MRRILRTTGVVLGICLAAASDGNPIAAAPPPYHFQHAGVLAPGAIGRLRLARGGPLSGYFQPVELIAPEGTKISPAIEGQFAPEGTNRLTAGFLISPVYRLRVTGIPNAPGQEVYPTLEVVDRLYPPPGSAWRFPVRVEISEDELKLALKGKFVTRVIYVEDPDQALANPEPKNGQISFDVGPEQDPLVVADQLGRPIAILRLGGRVPGPEGPDARFLYGSPPVRPSGE